jgi:hypothetical protein
MENPTVPMTQLPRGLTPDGARAADYLLHTFGGRLYAYFIFMIADDEAARRALTDTLVGVAADAEQVAGLGEWGPRIFLRARTECLRFEHALAVGGVQRGDGDPGDTGWSPGLPSIARRAVSRLSPEIREAFILSAPHNELSLPDLARVLGVPLESAADRRAQAGLDYVRALALCAEDAGYTTYAGAELRIRAEASLAQDSAELAPPLPVLTKLLQTASSNGQAPGSGRSPGTALAPFKATGGPAPVAPTTELPVLPAEPPVHHPAPPTRAERVPPELVQERTPDLPPRGEQFAGPPDPPKSPLPSDPPVRERPAPPPTRADPVLPELLQERMPDMLERRTRMERLAARPVRPERPPEPPTRIDNLPAVSSVEAERFGGPVGPTRMDWLRNSGPYRALTGPLSALSGPLATGGEDDGPWGPGGRRRARRKRMLLVGGSTIALVVLAGASYEFLFAGTSNSTISITPAGVPAASPGTDGYMTSTSSPRSSASVTSGSGTPSASSSATGDVGSGGRQTEPEGTAPEEQPTPSSRAPTPAPAHTTKAATSPSASPTAKSTPPAAPPSSTPSPSPSQTASSASS